MPKRTDIHSVLIIGAGPIIIDQAAEFSSGQYPRRQKPRPPSVGQGGDMPGSGVVIT